MYVEPFYRTENQDRSLTELFMDYKKTYEELNTLLSFSTDVKVQQAQRENIAVMGFLAALPSECESVKAQILSSPEISSFQETFNRILHMETSSSTPPSVQMSNAFVGWNIGESEKQQYRNSGPDSNSRGTSFGGVVCYYCHKPRHVIGDCEKQQSRNQRLQSAHVASTNEASDQSIQLTAEELVRFHLYQESLKSPSTPIIIIAESCNLNKCLVSSSSSEWVINPGATDQMPGNSSLFSTFQSQPSTFAVTLAKGSQPCVLRSGTIFPTPSLPLSSVLSLPNFSFNLMSVNKLTRALKCYISFFLDFYLFQDLIKKRIIGRGHESRGLCILDHAVPRPVACSRVTTPFETHCRLDHPFLPLLKKLCPQFSSFSSLDYESCQFAKHHCLPSIPRVNKQASAPFALIHTHVWGPCPIVSLTGFRYFVTFVDDYSRTTWLYLMKNRSELFSNFRAFYAEIHTQFHVFVQSLRSDNAKEYVSKWHPSSDLLR